MNLELKAVYFCTTNFNTWGKGYTIAEAKKSANVKASTKQQFVIQAAIFNDPTKDELSNLFACITADAISGGPVYYQDNRTEADTEMINRLHVGWLTLEKNYK